MYEGAERRGGISLNGSSVSRNGRKKEGVSVHVDTSVGEEVPRPRTDRTDYETLERDK